MHPRHRLGTWLVAALIAALFASPAGAQYFGTNKVQYKTLRFHVLETEHFDVYFHHGERQGADIAARLAERWYARLSELFDHRLRGRQPLVLYASRSISSRRTSFPRK